ncbi:MAG: endonuclease domain-containing protein [Candidatus Cloacimonadota bacterium]|nr:endonuclease domain-containing protein [Candidatus Cloacimonadota bacterium]
MAKFAFETARDLRKRSTVAEDAFWQIVRNRRFLDLKFKRQFPIEFDYEDRKRFFIADFYCHEKKLVVEIDGGIHESQKEYDELRDEIMNILGLKIIRFSNIEILNNLEKVKVNLTSIIFNHWGK